MVTKRTGFPITRTIKIHGESHRFNFVLAYSTGTAANQKVNYLKATGWAIRTYTYVRDGKTWYAVYKAKRWWGKRRSK